MSVDLETADVAHGRRRRKPRPHYKRDAGPLKRPQRCGYCGEPMSGTPHPLGRHLLGCPGGWGGNE